MLRSIREALAPGSGETATNDAPRAHDARERNTARNLGVVALLFVAGIAATFGFSLIGLELEASFLVFILGILIAAIETESGLWGIGLGVMYLLVYDLFFVAPHLSLAIFNRTDAVTLVIFAIVAFITGALTNRMKQQVAISERNAQVLRRLNKISTGLIDSTSADGACAFSADMLSSMMGRTVEITLGTPDADALAARSSADDARAAVECYEQGYQTGSGVSGYIGCRMRFIPLSAKTKVHGTVAIDCTHGGLDLSSKSFLESVLKQTAIAVERNELEEHARADELKIERERFKTTLLRSVSHDLRTPLAGIQGNAEFLEQNLDQIDPDERTALLGSISKDARWLAEMIDNLLSMTRVQDDDVPLDFQPEVVDDVIGDAVMHEMPYRGEHEIIVTPPEDVELVPMDGKLIRQVLVNLIDNAIKHAAPTARIWVSTMRDGDRMLFRVADDGGGIEPAMLGKIFGRFVSEDAEPGRKSGIGLGLSICKAIVEAHGGMIVAYNNDRGGATFEFSLPMEHDDESDGKGNGGAAHAADVALAGANVGASATADASETANTGTSAADAPSTSSAADAPDTSSAAEVPVPPSATAATSSDARDAKEPAHER